MSLKKDNFESQYLIIRISYNNNYNYTYINNIIFKLFEEYKYNKYWYILKSNQKNQLTYFIYSLNSYINIKKISYIFNYLFDLNNPLNKLIYIYFGCYQKKIFNKELNNHNNLICFIKKENKWEITNLDYKLVLK